MKDVLQVTSLSKRLDQWDVLQDISFTLARGETLGIIGPSGCGKSTLLQLVAGHIPPDSGEITLFGEKIDGFSTKIAMMPQQDMLMPWATLLDNAALPLRLRGENRAVARAQAAAHMDSFGLSGFEGVYPSQLSGGMRQRAAMLRTVLSRAQVLLLDEPLGALDAITRGQMQDFLLAKTKDLAATVLLVTHDVEEAIYLSHRVIVLSGRPAHIAYVQELPRERSRDWMLTQECAQIRRALFDALG